MNKENNVFYQNRKAIQAICQRDNCDVSVGTSKFIHEAQLTGYHADLDDWQALCRAYMMDKQRTLADLFR
ncbi:MAG: hypothetical protein HFF00_04765 [Ruminiclostridium sp.]|jgi:hypothetical protein|nr:hypothetical protein [Ruminiclostridium sp.]